MKFHPLVVLSVTFLATDISAFIRPLSNHKVSLAVSDKKGRVFLSTEQATSSSDNGLQLPPELQKITDAFAMVDDDSLRHKQLLYMANQMPKITKDQMIPENKVPGCLSTVYVDGSAQWCDERDNYIINYVGESDGLLTKGLAALLIRGLSGNTAEEIQAVNPEFIQAAKIGQSLTPGRNNGFLNMLAVMKKKALEISNQAKSNQSDESSSSDDKNSNDVTSATEGPIYKSIIDALQVLKPDKLDLVDTSDQNGDGVESHFQLEVFASVFEDLGMDKRQKLVYMLLGEIVPNIEDIKITALTKEES
eukprot:CAMPEP_0194232170 /NCGR_PEP_ID=MMETSP0158-20130606/647_1 /TAXON_ID=33649 /ORGANISM="Thalassionema nitzschioides, Strain L26-B" /LENGTH=305 /DNA_ID=CAMNT_0038964899 /DNA_START=11 /DNA_END=928 /DNA_ORIENTATION=+